MEQRESLQAGADAETVEEWCKVEWDCNPQIRAEFTSRETWIAYKKAVHAGRAKVHSSNSVVRG